MRQSIKKEIFSNIISTIPISILSRITRTSLVIPYYHIINDMDALHVKYLYKYKRTGDFKMDLDFLLKNFHPIDLHELIQYIKNNNPIKNNSFLLTFDDGFREIHDIVAPILLEKGIPATFFLTTSFIDNKDLAYDNKSSILLTHSEKLHDKTIRIEIERILNRNEIHYKTALDGILNIEYKKRYVLNEIAEIMDVDFNDYLNNIQPYLNSDQIKSLIKKRFTIGAHSIDHPLYASISINEQIFQTIESIKLLREKFSLNYGAFAFPHSDRSVTKAFFNEINNSGFIDISFGTAGMIKDEINTNFQRFSLERPVIPARQKIGMEFAKKYVRILKHEDIIQRN